MATFTLNGKQVEAPDGMNLIQAAQMHGVTIPHYCYHPGLSVAGNCRMCLCEIDGPRGPAPTIACSTMVREGLVVRTDTPAVEKMRKGVQEFLLLNHPIDCPICDQAGECRLQDYYMDYGRYDNRSAVSKVQKQKVVDIGPMVILDQERCILCTRCVRFCNEISASDELIVSGRGDASVIETFPGMQLDNPYSGNVVDVCPVGALTSKDFRFKARVWFLKTTKSLCNGCARGCNTLLDHKDSVAYRFRPRENPHVNGWWMTDDGRLSYKQFNENRLTQPHVRGKAETIDGVAIAIAGLFASSRPEGAYVVVGSPFSSLEDNVALQAIAARLLNVNTVYGYDATPDGESDDFLMHADKTPNRTGLRYLGFEMGRQALLDALSSANAQVAVVMNNDLAVDPGLAEALRKVPTIVYLGSHDNATSALANHVLPTASHAEKYGSFVNFQGRIQRFFKAWDAPGGALAEWDSLARIAWHFDAAQGGGIRSAVWLDTEDLWTDLRAAKPELAEVSWYGLGDEGFQIPSLGEVCDAPRGLKRAAVVAAAK